MALQVTRYFPTLLFKLLHIKTFLIFTINKY